MSRSIAVVRLALAVVALAPACAHPEGHTTPDCPDRVAPAAGSGIEPSVLSAAVSAQGVAKMEVELGMNGELEEVALYHMDESHVPAAVRATASEKFPGHTVRQYELEQTPQGPEYEVELTTTDGRSCEVAAREDGTFLYQECELPAADLPASVRQSAEGAVPGGTIREVEKHEGAGQERYNVEIEAAGAMHYVVVGADGQVQRHARVIPAEVQVRVR